MRRSFCALGLTLLTVGLRADDTRTTLDEVLSRAAAYLRTYEAQLASVVAVEHYEQKYTSWEIVMTTILPERRTLDSDFLFLRLPGNSAWLGLRDTFRVDGKDVRPANSGAFRDLRVANADDVTAAMRISAENARRNLGAVHRTINVPTTVLDFFTDSHRGRFRFSKLGEEKNGGHVTWLVRFIETARPTIIRTAEGADQRSRGTASIDPATGAIDKTVLDLGDDGREESFVRSRITVRYSREPALGFLVPVEMAESYYRPRSREYGELQITANAVYSRFSRFQTSATIR